MNNINWHFTVNAMNCMNKVHHFLSKFVFWFASWIVQASLGMSGVIEVRFLNEEGKYVYENRVFKLKTFYPKVEKTIVKDGALVYSTFFSNPLISLNSLDEKFTKCRILSIA